MRAQTGPWPIALVLIISCCSAPPAPVSQREIAAYLHQLTEWAPQEAEVGRAVRRILDTEFADEAEVRRQLSESRPRLEQQLLLLHTHRPDAPEIREVHASYVAAWVALRDGYGDILRGLDSGDQAMLGRGRQALLAWRRALPATARRLRDLGATQSDQGPPT